MLSRLRFKAHTPPLPEKGIQASPRLRQTRIKSPGIMSSPSGRIGTDLSYVSEDLLETCDILLRLDDGNVLPAHWLYLAGKMQVFAAMVKEGLFADATPTNMVTVPFSECSMVDAKLFLLAVYSSTLPQMRRIDNASVLPIARLSHKYGWQVWSSHCGLPQLLQALPPVEN